MPTLPRASSNCLNCGAAIADARFCSACGQENVPPLHSTRELARHYAEDAFSLDNRLLRTLALLVGRPGRLTTEYLAGRRQHYVRPLRLYLLASIAFFASVGLRFDPSRVVPAETAAASADSTLAAPPLREGGGSHIEELEGGGFRVELDDNASAKVDLGLLGELAFLPVVGPRLAAREAELERMDPNQLLQLGLSALMRHAPKAIFLLAPMTGLVLKLLYIRRSRYYVEHLIFALHWHALIFVVLLVILLNPWTPLDVCLVLLTPLYLLFALRHVYRQSWWRTIFKHQLVLWSYVPGSVVAVLCLTLLSALTL